MTRRLFVAVEPPDACRELVASARDALARAFPDVHVRWQPDENLHLTLAFLGDVPETGVAACGDRLEEHARRARRFDAATTRLGAFPSPRRPSVIWLGIEAEPADALTRLQRDVADAFRHLSDERRPYRPHLTLGRVKGPPAGDRSDLAAALAELPGDRVRWRVERVVLFDSVLARSGAVHTPLRTATIPA